MPHQRIALTSFLLRTGLAIVFLYAGVATFLEPHNWAGYIPSFVREAFPASVFLILFSSFEILLALWLFSGKRAYHAATCASVTIFLITISNLNLLDVIFRDVAILAMSLALVSMTKPE
jgi:uncharacterized membrane protein